MKFSTQIALLALASSVSASMQIASSSKCWRKCARKVGIECGWGDVDCNCSAVNDGLYAAANQCYCNLCSDDASRITAKWTALKLNTFGVACAMSGHKLDREAKKKAISAATCEATGSNTIVVPIASTSTREGGYSYSTVTVPVDPNAADKTTIADSSLTTTTTITSVDGNKAATRTTVSHKATKTAHKTASALAARMDVDRIDPGISFFALAIAAFFGIV